jgi:hypothetical protein
VNSEPIETVSVRTEEHIVNLDGQGLPSWYDFQSQEDLIRSSVLDSTRRLAVRALGHAASNGDPSSPLGYRDATEPNKT